MIHICKQYQDSSFVYKTNNFKFCILLGTQYLTFKFKQDIKITHTIHSNHFKRKDETSNFLLQIVSKFL